MSTLAERRNKKKWSVDPNGSNWSKDENKFGMKMLERMGWTQGKGLGANEDGRVEHIKIKHKNDNRGVGCSMKHEQNWLAHQDDFANLLSQLNDHHSDQTEVKNTSDKGVSSLEKKSKSQKRVHYHKFARGKDLSNYREDDLAAIFGKTVSKSAPATPLNLSEGEASDAGSTSSCPEKKKRKKKKSKKNKDIVEPKDNPTNHVTSTMSVQEYFAQRMAALKNKASSSSNSPSSERNDDDASEKQNEVEQEDIPSETDQPDIEKTSKKKKKKKKSEKTEIEPEVTDNNEMVESNRTVDKSSKKKKKSKAKNNENFTNSKEKKLPEINNSEIVKTKKKSKKRKIKENEGNDANPLSKMSKKENGNSD